MNRIGNTGLFLIGVALCIWAFSYYLKLNMPSKNESDFQIAQLGDMARNQFLINKRTGRIWQRVCSGEAKGFDCNGEIMWDEMYVSDITPEDTSAARLHHWFVQMQIDKASKK